MLSPASPTAPIRVLFVLTGYVGGGAERSLLELIRRLDPGLVAPAIAVLDPEGPLRLDFRRLGVPLVELNADRGLARFRGALVLASVLRFRPQIVHGRLLLANLWARLGVVAGAKVVCEERNLSVDRPAGFTLINRLSLPLCSVVVANSQAVADHIRRRDDLPPNKLRVIPGGVDADRFLPTEAERGFDLVSLTRLESSKGVFDLLAAMRIVAARRPGTRLLLVGDGSRRDEVERTLRDSGLGDRIRLMGWSEQPERELARAKVFVLASHEEGMPNAVLEAMACGLPVVATAVGGTTELVDSGVTGRLVAPHCPDALADALLFYLDQPKVIADHGAAGRQRVLDQFSFRRTVDAYQNLYRELATS